MFRSSSVGQRPTSSVPSGTRSQLQNGAVQRGLGALPSTSKMDASPGGGASIFGMMGPSCPACRFLHPRNCTQSGDGTFLVLFAVVSIIMVF